MIASLFLGIFGMGRRDCGGFVVAFGRKELTLRADSQGDYGTMTKNGFAARRRHGYMAWLCPPNGRCEEQATSGALEREHRSFFERFGTLFTYGEAMPCRHDGA